MKKLIAISVLFALLAVGAFAQVSGGFRAQWVVVDNDGVNDATTHSGITDATVKLSGENEEGTIGAQLKISGLGGTTVNVGGDDYNLLFGSIAESWAWWQPIPQVRLSLGNFDGFWGYDGIVGWGFHEGNADYGHMEGYSFGAGHAGGFAWHGDGFALALKPIDGLEIDFGLFLNKESLLEDAFKYIYVQGSYDLSGIGQIYVTYNSESYEETLNPITNDVLNTKYGALGIGFHLKALENIPIVLLVKFDLNSEADANEVGLSIGAGFSSGDFGVRFRAASTFVKDGDFNLHAQIMPFYDLGIFKAFLNIGFSVNGDDTRFYLNPYITKDIGPGKIGLGIQVDITENATKFSLPVTIGYNF